MTRRELFQKVLAGIVLGKVIPVPPAPLTFKGIPIPFDPPSDAPYFCRIYGLYQLNQDNPRWLGVITSIQ